jgi:chemotaxis signal transduction protein
LASSTPTSRPDDAPPLLTDEDVPAPEVLLVRVGDHEWALPAAAAREVVRWRPFTRVPGAPAWVVGLVNLRGAVVPVADLTLRLAGRPVNRAGAWIVLLEDGARRGGFAVCAVRDVRTVAATHDGLALPAWAAPGGPTRGAVCPDDADAGAVPLLDPAILLDELTAEGDR